MPSRAFPPALHSRAQTQTPIAASWQCSRWRATTRASSIQPTHHFRDRPCLFDLYVTWIGWDGFMEEGFDVVKVATSTSGPTYIVTDGRSTIIVLPNRSVDDPSPDAGVQFWRRVDQTGAIDSAFGMEPEFGLNFLADVVLADDEIVTSSAVDDVANLLFWHLTDQGLFFDDSGMFEDEIEELAAAGITLGCDPDGYLFCPDDAVTRAQMATFIARWLHLDLDAPERFSDDDGSVHEASINAIAEIGITLGCDSADPTLFCPDDVVTREQMASFIARALLLADDFSDRFTDDDGSPHELAIDAIATLGVTLGCDGADPALYCPNDPVLRKHMAAFIVRAGV